MSLNELKKLPMNIKTGSTQIHNVKNPIKKNNPPDKASKKTGK